MEPFIEPELSKFTVYSKSGCSNCDEYILENKAEFLQFIEKKALTPWKTFPIIFDGILVANFVGNKFVGGFTELKVYLNKELDFTTDF